MEMKPKPFRSPKLWWKKEMIMVLTSKKNDTLTGLNNTHVSLQSCDTKLVNCDKWSRINMEQTE
jgi:hypothetical protein